MAEIIGINRLSEVYDMYTGDDFLEDQAELLSLFHDSKQTAVNIAREWTHTQSKERRLTFDTSETLFKSFEDTSELFKDEAIRNHYFRILNTYIKSVQESTDGEYKMKTLIVYLSFAGLMYILPDLEFNEKYKELVNNLNLGIIEKRQDIVNQMIEYFKSAGVPKHLEVVKEVGSKILSIRIDRSIPKYFGTIVDEKLPHDTYEVLLDLRNQYINITETLRKSELQELVGIGASTFRRYQTLVIEELRNSTSDTDIQYLNELLKLR